MSATRQTLILPLLLFLLAGMATTASARERLSGTLVITGSSTMAPLIAEMGRLFERKHSGVEVTVYGSNSAKGLSDARRDRNSIGMVSRMLNERERGLRAFPVAVDAICFIVSSRSSVRSLSRDQLSRIFSGNTGNWRELGGRDEPIRVLLRDDNRSSTKIISEYLHIDIPQLKGVIIPAASAVAIKAIASNSSAIGYVSFAEAYRYAGNYGKIRLLAIDGEAPTKAGIINGTYPLIRVLNLVVKGEPTPLARKFIEFCRSKAVADTVLAHDFLTLGL